MIKKFVKIVAISIIFVGALIAIKNNSKFSFVEQPILADSIDIKENNKDLPIKETNNIIIIDEVKDNTDKSTDKKTTSNNTKDINSKDEENKLMATNIEDTLVLVNKSWNLPSDYKPSDLIVPDVKFSFKEKLEKRYLREEAAKALEELFNTAAEDDVILYAVSGYRSYKTQKSIFEGKVSRVGFEAANKVSAVPGQSEHQTGLSMDVSCEAVNFTLEEDFGQTVEGKWISENAHEFGFIVRYLKEKTNITGYSYEPWHIRYVGKDVAKKIYDNKITLEEYLEDIQ